MSVVDKNLKGYGQNELPQEITRRARNLEKLNINNYNTWRMAMIVQLTYLSLWNEKEKEPIKGQQSHYEIFMQLEKSNYILLMDVSCGKEAWKKLENTFMKNGLNSRHLLLRELLNLKWTEGTIQQHNLKFLEIQAKCLEMGSLDRDAIMLAVYLESLPDRFDPYIMSLDAQGTKHQLTEIMTTVGNMKEEKRSESAFRVERPQTQKHQYKKYDKSKIECFKCGKFGHYKAECRTGNENRVHFEKRKTFYAGKGESSDWIFDSGCAEHLTYDEEDLVEVQDLAENMTFCSANSVFVANKKGKLLIDGIELSDVYIVPELKAKLLSVGKLCEVGSVEIGTDEARWKVNGRTVSFRKRNGVFKH